MKYKNAREACFDLMEFLGEEHKSLRELAQSMTPEPKKQDLNNTMNRLKMIDSEPYCYVRKVDRQRHGGTVWGVTARGQQALFEARPHLRKAA